MKRRTVVVDGPLAYRMQRIAAAQEGALGVQILSIPLLAARLAGGFLRPAEPQELDEAIRAALAQGGFADIQTIRDLPGMTRAVSSTLRRLWDADFPLQQQQTRSSRLLDLAVVESRIKESLSRGALMPRDLRSAALARANLAGSVLGPLELWYVADVPPLWRPLIQELTKYVQCTWRSPAASVEGWFAGEVAKRIKSDSAKHEVESCANPRAEAVEALRWARQLIASGTAEPGQIAICATTTAEWDEHFLVLASDSKLPLHFSHGVPALASRDGQACAALADILLNGISQARIRRYLGHAAGHVPGLEDLPHDWWIGIESEAALHDLAHWRRALSDALSRRTDGKDIRQLLIPCLELLEKGVGRAVDAGVMLPAGARALWSRALQQAPASAIEYSLRAMRVPHGRDPGASIVWCPAKHLEGAPRPWVRLLGLTSRSWPRPALEDPLLPSYLLERAEQFETVRETDRRAFHAIIHAAGKGSVVVMSRRNAQGGLQAASPLLAEVANVQHRGRSRVPEHAFSEADRLLARPKEACLVHAVASAQTCWRDWHVATVTSHDGLTSPQDSVVARAMGQTQSATSLRPMLRNPIAFMWRYALGWRRPIDDDQPLSLDATVFGELVHELLKRTVDKLEPAPGLMRASPNELEAALLSARTHTDEQWIVTRATPPGLLWQHTLNLAIDYARKALTLDEAFEAGTRSWTEVAFGWDDPLVETRTDIPWKASGHVSIPGTRIRIRGTIDRVDLRLKGDAVRVSDYKTGVLPKHPDKVIFGQGGELQRVTYAIAAKELLPGPPKVVARLVYLGSDSPTFYKLMPNAVDQAIVEMAAYLNVAQAALSRGLTLPGPDADLERNEFRLALPAALPRYLQTKRPSINRAFGGEFTKVWKCP